MKDVLLALRDIMESATKNRKVFEVNKDEKADRIGIIRHNCIVKVFFM